MSENRGFFTHIVENTVVTFFKIQKRDFYIFWSDMSKNIENVIQVSEP